MQRNTLPVDDEIKLLFPSIMRYKSQENRFVGIFKNRQNGKVFATFTVPNYPQASGLSFDIGLDINETTYQNLITKTDNLTFLEFLKTFSQVILTAPKQKVFNHRFFSKFMNEFHSLKNNFRDEKFEFDEKNEILTITHTDEYSVQKYITLKLDFYQDHQLFEVVSHNLPPVGNMKLFHDQISLQLIHKTFLYFVGKLVSFHEALKKIDSMCWVTAPPNPTFEDVFRTVMISESNVTMKITFNPWKMCSTPEFRFFGPSSEVQRFKDKLADNLSQWNLEGDVLNNIKMVLELPFFPVKPSGAEGISPDLVLYDSDTECCVCFSYYLGTDVPTIRCNNECCRRYFHQECLYEWLSRLPNNVYFDSITGSCPNCDKTISCRAVDK